MNGLRYNSTNITLGRLALREEHRLGVFENRVLRRTFGPKRIEGNREAE
jgi:hypothetical protein